MVLNTVFLLGAIHGLFLALLLATKKVHVRSNRLLSVLMLTFTADLAMASFMGFKLYETFPHLLGLDFPITMLYGPILFLYTQSLIYPQWQFDSKSLLHLIPFLVVLVYMIPFYLSEEEQKLTFVGKLNSFSYGSELFTHLKIIFNVAYLIPVAIHIKKLKDRTAAKTSPSDSGIFKWLKSFIVLLLAFLFVVIGIHLFATWKGEINNYGDYTLLAVTVFVYGIGYMGLRQPEFLSEPNMVLEKVIANSSQSYSRSGLNSARGEALFKELENLMNEKKIYRNSSLKLNELAALLNISSHNLTEILNVYGGTNFYDFVNRFRVDEVKSALRNPENDNLTLLAVATEAGFNSKASFNSVFKKHVGLTPSAFKKSVKP